MAKTTKKQAPEFKQFWTYEPEKDNQLNYEFNFMEPDTRPGEAMTIQEIMQRALKGMPLTERKPIYFDQEDIRKINSFFSPHVDLTDLDALREFNAEMELALNKATSKSLENTNQVVDVKKTKDSKPEKSTSPGDEPES